MIGIKSLYDILVRNKYNEFKGWHNGYQYICEWVDKIRTKGYINNDNDNKFLERLILDKSNGVSSVGSSLMSNEQFQTLITNQDFIDKLMNFIKQPNNSNLKIIDDKWYEIVQKHNTLRINRIAAACTREVSTTVDYKKFNNVFDWIIKESDIEKYSGEQDWFSKNQYLMKKIKEKFSEEDKPDDYYLSMFVWAIYKNINNPFIYSKQIIRYGAPGTGKTYTALQNASNILGIWKDNIDKLVGYSDNLDCFTDETQVELVQFHPSFSYEDFIDGLRPIIDNNGETKLTLQNGIFKDFCIKAGKWEVDFYYALKQNVVELEWESCTVKEIQELKEKNKDFLSKEYWNYIFNIKDKDQLLCKVIPPFVFIIDEINRAELSRVFGELMYSLEYRGTKGLIKTQYSQLNIDETGMIKVANNDYKFFIPTNIYIIGTMNTIDRSVESFDFALRRRFQWEEVTPDIDLLKNHLSEYNNKYSELADNLKSLNDKILEEPLLGSDYMIGHAYLWDLPSKNNISKDYTDINELRMYFWDNRIKSLLQEYLRGTDNVSERIEYFKKILEFNNGK